MKNSIVISLALFSSAKSQHDQRDTDVDYTNELNIVDDFTTVKVRFIFSVIFNFSMKTFFENLFI